MSSGNVVTCEEKLQESYLQLGHCMTYRGGGTYLQLGGGGGGGGGQVSGVAYARCRR